MTQNEWLLDFWDCAYNGYKGVSKYELLKIASKIRWRDDIMTKERLGFLRQQFIVDHVVRKKYPMSDQCWICGYNPDDSKWKEQYFLVRHHIIALSKWGSNRKANIVTLCSRCHTYFHPWLKRTMDEVIQDFVDKRDKSKEQKKN